MRSFIHLVLLSLVLLEAFSEEVLQSDSDLVLVQVLWRHGARAPKAMKFFVPPGINASDWPRGLGQLSDKGIKEQYRLGQFLRSRYGSLIENYSPQKVYARSGDADRALMSAEACLAGTFPDQPWTSPLGMSWQPIPVHGVPKPYDTMLYLSDSNCPGQKRKDIFSYLSPKNVTTLWPEYADVVAYVEEKSGLKIKNSLDLFNIYDILSTYRSHNVAAVLPTWATDQVFTALKNANEEATAYYHNHELFRLLRKSELFSDLAQRMQNKANGSSNSGEQYIAYSAYGTTVRALLADWHIYTPQMTPSVSACIMVELHKRSTGDHFVKILYRNRGELKVLSIPGCDGEECPLERFVGFAKKEAARDMTEACRKLHEDS
uniref:acid phosphatase n=1 Tax=Trichuris muris TaxID=70415 RepID=A0A5S6QQM0_TRIMR